MKNIINRCLQEYIKFGILLKAQKRREEIVMNNNIFKEILHVNRERQYSSEEEPLSINCLQKFYPRQYDILKKMNIQTIDDLSQMTTFDLIDNPAFEHQNPQMLIRAVHLLGYSFQDEQLTEAAAKERTRRIS